MAKDVEEYRFEVIKFMVDLAAKWASLFFVAAIAAFTLYTRFAANADDRLLISIVGLASCVLSMFVFVGVLVVVEIAIREFMHDLETRLKKSSFRRVKGQTRVVLVVGRVMFSVGMFAGILLAFVFFRFIQRDLADLGWAFGISLGFSRLQGLISRQVGNYSKIW